MFVLIGRLRPIPIDRLFLFYFVFNQIGMDFFGCWNLAFVAKKRRKTIFFPSLSASFYSFLCLHGNFHFKLASIFKYSIIQQIRIYMDIFHWHRHWINNRKDAKRMNGHREALKHEHLKRWMLVLNPTSIFAFV